VGDEENPLMEVSLVGLKESRKKLVCFIVKIRAVL